MRRLVPLRRRPPCHLSGCTAWACRACSPAPARNRPRSASRERRTPARRGARPAAWRSPKAKACPRKRPLRRQPQMPEGPRPRRAAGGGTGARMARAPPSGKSRTKAFRSSLLGPTWRQRSSTPRAIKTAAVGCRPSWPAATTRPRFSKRSCRRPQSTRGNTTAAQSCRSCSTPAPKSRRRRSSQRCRQTSLRTRTTPLAAGSCSACSRPPRARRCCRYHRSSRRTSSIASRACMATSLCRSAWR
mmetsp:Transcript_66174/g.191753  ORF Transcript_66174/g.191753 Transcript_66174/m.191753 type:complete len:245 (+) Transcript_66174:354-1088(+)